MIGPGKTLLHYRLSTKIGEGGMGVVWRATDTTLDRDVAIKVLPAAFEADPERLARFEREARLLATLSHPNIATIHGLHAAGGVRFLAMELAAGEDLAARIARGPLPLDEALGFALQIAEALEAAHERGVIHRDLKPANIRVDAEGRVKILDFGLAKAFEGDPSSPAADPSRSPTLTALGGTQAGMILGTAAYMSAEQARGRPVDKRADVWAFGCVLFEMLAGRRAFAGETVSETLASVIKDEPVWDALPEGTPAPLRRLLRRCLTKDPRQRLRDVGDARIVVAEMRSGRFEADGAAVSAAPAAARGPAWRWLPWALVAVIAALALWGWSGRGAAPPRATRSTHLSVALGDDERLTMMNHDFEVMPSLALSPAGDRLVYVGHRRGGSDPRFGGSRLLRARPLDGFATEVLRGTEDGESPFFSPDGRWIGFFEGNTLCKVPAAGGARVILAQTSGPGNGASWATDDTIVFAHSFVGPLWSVSASGGEPRPLTRLAENERSHRYPQVLPGGRAVLFTIKPRGILSFDDGMLAVADRATGEHRVLAERGTYARYVEPGYLVYARAGGLLAAPFDPERLEVSGGAVPVIEGVLSNGVTGAAQFEVGRDGTLIFVRGDAREAPTTLVRVERESGRREVLVANALVAAPQLSADEKRILMHGSAANDQVLVLDIERRTVLRVSEPTSNNVLPVWGPAGEGIVYSTDRSGAQQIVWRPADGGPETTLVEGAGQPQEGRSWSPDGRLLLINRGPTSSRDVWVLDRASGAGPVALLDSPAYEGDATFSPDGKWIAYASDESGSMEIYLVPYPGAGTKIQASTGGGFGPRWRGDGGELYYQTERALFAVPIVWDGVPRPGTPERIIDVATGYSNGYDVSRDGKRFYVIEFDLESRGADRIEVVLDWDEELRRRVE